MPRALPRFVPLRRPKSQCATSATPRLRTKGLRRVSHPAWHCENAHENDNELRTRKAEAYRKAHRLQMPAAPKIRPRDRCTIRVKTRPAIRAARSSFACVEFPENLAVLQRISHTINSR